jgi:hypothetical protein
MRPKRLRIRRLTRRRKVRKESRIRPTRTKCEEGIAGDFAMSVSLGNPAEGALFAA